MHEKRKICDWCREAISPEEIGLGWPVAVPDVDGMDWDCICPSCYGDEAYCPEGHVLPAAEGEPCKKCVHG